MRSIDSKASVPRRLRAALALIGGLIAAPAAQSAGFSGIVTLATEYIYRGQAVSGHDPAISAGVDFEHASGLFAGIWASSVDIESGLGEREVELDYYAGYHWTSSGPLAYSATLIRYTYPDQSGYHSYDHNEWLLSATWNGRHSLEFGYTTDLYGLGRTGRHWQLRSEFPTRSGWVVGAGLGHNDLGEVGSSRYLHWDLGASIRYRFLTADLRWFDNEDPGGAFEPLSAGSRIVLSLSWAF